MTGGITDGQQDRFIVVAGLGQSFFIPGIPVHWVVSVLQKVRASCVYQVISVVRIMHWVASK
jgi:hypothetical protein